jgi:hypothetical protein
MKGMPWGELYNAHKDEKLDPKKLELRVATLMADDEIQKKSGIYPFVLTGHEKYLNLRAFTDSQKREAYERQQGVCPICKKNFQIEEMEADHITPWHTGGMTIPANCQMICKEDNRRKGGT